MKNFVKALLFVGLTGISAYAADITMTDIVTDTITANGTTTLEIAGNSEIKTINNNATILNSGKLTISNILNNEGTFTNSDTMTAVLNNSNKIDGQGRLNIIGNSVNSGTITQLSISINENGTLTTNADNISSTISIMNDGTLVFNSGTNNNEILGDGTVVIDGDITNNIEIVNKITIKENKSLTTSANYLLRNIDNNGSLKLTSGTNNQIINGSGSVLIDGDIINANMINQDVTINSEKSLLTDASYINGSISNAGTLTFNGGTNANAITGTGSTVIDGDVINTGSIANAITINAEKSLTSNASNLTGDITNNGTLTFNGGTNANAITGTGSTIIDGNLINTGSIANAITINAEKSLTSNASSLTGDITNNGSLTFNGGTNANDIAGAGSTVIDGDVINTGSIANAITINAEKSLTSNASSLTGDITNNGSLTFNGGTNANAITGKGSITISSDVVNSNTVEQTTITVNNNTNFTNNNEITAAITNNGTIKGNGTLTITGNSINAGTIEQNNIVVNNIYTLTNNEKKSITAQLENNGTFANNGIFSGSITNNNIINGIGTLNINDTSINNGIFTQNTVTIDNSGSLTNNEEKSITVNTLLTNNGSISNNGTITAILDNKSTIDGTGTLILNGNSKNSSSITQNSLQINKNSVLSNTSNLNIQNLIDNNGIITTSTSIATDSVINSGTIALASTTNLTMKNLTNTGSIEMNGSSKLISTEQANNIAGEITVKGADNYFDIKGSNTTITSNILIGDGNNTTLNIDSGNIIKSANLTIKDNANVYVNNNSSLSIDNSDKWTGYIELNSAEGTVNFDSLSKTVTPELFLQKDGNLNIINNSHISLTDTAILEKGNLNIDEHSSIFLMAKNGEANSITTPVNINSTGTINSMNRVFEENHITTLTIDNSTNKAGVANFAVDISMRATEDNILDTYTIDTITSKDGSKKAVVNISNWNYIGDKDGKEAPLEKSIKIGQVFISENIDENVIFTATKKELETPIGMYQLRASSAQDGSYSFERTRYNPKVFRGQIATISQYMNQLMINDILFDHAMVIPNVNAKDTMANKYAAALPQYSPYLTDRADSGVWVKMYGNFEHLQMRQNLRVGNNAYGMLVGANFKRKHLKNGWNFTPSAYFGYNGAYQYWAGTNNYENGGQIGFMGTFSKKDFINTSLVYGGVYGVEMSTPRGNDDAFNYFAGFANKSAYNFHPFKDFIVQPSVLLSYNFFGKQNWHSNYGVMSMNSGFLNGINIAPGVNFILQKKTWSAYITLQYMYNIMGSVMGQAGSTILPHIAMERGYIQYGFGATKYINDRLNSYGQITFRNVGRTGVGFQLGMQLFLGKKQTLRKSSLE
ncbi:MAG: hypothetical protein NC200_02000 [Candidatus Gastranaerophilales bacterium]|nr:hypothetical protein [Candidatus Gastranaerophilales bacterium]